MIRPANRDDAEQMALLYNHYIQTTTATFEEQPLVATLMQERLANINSRGLPWLVHLDSGQISAYAYARPWNERSAYRFTVEVSIYVLAAATGKGIGRRLYQALFHALNELGLKQVLAIITLPNEASVALHECFGMTQVAHLKRVGFKFDRWLDVGYWQADLARLVNADIHDADRAGRVRN